MFKNLNVINAIINNKSLKKYLIIILILTITNIVLSIINDNNEQAFLAINDKYNKLKTLSNDEFVLKHLFKEDANNTKNFIEYVKNYIKNNYGEVNNIKTLDKQNLYDITVETIEFDLQFPHDKFIFDLIETIQKYSNGFVIIPDIYIKKAEKFNINKNNLNTNIICQLYTK